MERQRQVCERVLLVEDEGLVAMLMEAMLEDVGCRVAATAARLEQAVTLAAAGDFDLAVLDVNLAGKLSYPVAEALRERGIPFLFATGYGAAGLPAALRDAPVLVKPVEPAALMAAVRRLGCTI